MERGAPRLNADLPTQMNVEFTNVGFGFRNKPIIHDLTLHAVPGEFLAIVGPNGSGKSTTLKLLAGLHRCLSGTINIGGRDAANLHRRELALRVACLTQSGAVPPELTVTELVAMGRFAHQGFFNRRSPQDDLRVADAMQVMNVTELAARRVGSLSGGQLQRCRMAMTLAQDCPILLLDEPTTYLDLKYQHAILQTARSQARAGRTVIAVLHDFTQASIYADRIAVMQHGRLACLGRPAEVLTEELVSDVFGIDTRVVKVDGAVFHLPSDMAENAA